MPDAGSQLTTTVSSPLRQDNLRIYYVRAIDENAGLIKAVQAGVGTKCKLTGHAVSSLTAAGGDYVLVWAPEAVGLVGFVLLPERLTHNSNPEDPIELEAVVQKVLTPPVKSKLIFPGLAPLRVKAPLGTRINELGNRNTTAKNPYDSQSLLEAARQLWDDCDCSDHASRMHASSAVPSQQLLRQPPCLQTGDLPKQPKKRKAEAETKQLNKSMLMDCLRDEGFSQSKAQQMWDSVARSKSWTITKIPSADDEPALIFQVFKSDQPLTPIITAPFETVYKQLAKLWKKDFEDTQLKPASKAPRYTRQQEKTAAAKEVHLLTEGLNEVQMKQMRDMIADSLKPIAEEQQQQKYAVAAVQSAQNATATKIETHADALGQIGPALQQMAACWSLQQQQQQRFFLPGLQYASAGPAFVPTPSQYAEAHSQCGPALAPSQHAPAFGTMS